MFDRLKRLFGGGGGKRPDWQAEWDSRKAALQSLLGPADDEVLTAMPPIYLGGGCDVLKFRNAIPGGVAFVTAGLTGPLASQPATELGTYELMICTRGNDAEDDKTLPDLISGLATYTLKKPLRLGETMDLGEHQPPGVTTRRLLAILPPMPTRFNVLNVPSGILLLVTITAAEMEAVRSDRHDEAMAKLKKSVFPFSSLRRRSLTF